MCGIVGRVNAAGRCVEREALTLATRVLAHRGPDGEGLHVEGPVGLGHRRLSIVDRLGGAQPMANEDGSIWVTFNGEIYNHRLLRAELESKGHVFATRSDTEVLVHGYEEWGEEIPSALRGMFAFAIWDARQQSLLLVRDRLGIKPVYWSRVGQDLVFASEIKALFAFPDVVREHDLQALPSFLALRYIPGPRTAFKGIQRLQPGHLLTYRDDEVRIRPFWDVPVRAAEQRSTDEIEESETLSQLIQSAVRLHLMGEVPVGVFLSGGIDSATTAWAMRQAETSPPTSFSLGYEDPGQDELPYAHLAAEAIGTRHRDVVIDSQTFGDSMEDLAWHLDEPNSDGACIPLMHLARGAREEVVVVLSGEGADELLGGYQIYGKMLTIDRLRALGGPLVDPTLTVLARVVPQPKVRKYVGLARRPLERRYLGVSRAFTDELIDRVFGPGTMEVLIEDFAPLWDRAHDVTPLDQMLYIDTKVCLPDDLLIKADKMTMAASVELRVPFLDHELLEYAWTLPAHLKRRGRVGKRLLRVAMAGKLPQQILTRPKQGFPVPLRHWLRTSLFSPCREVLLAASSSARAHIGEQLIDQLLTEHRSGRADRTEELYALWVWETWHRVFLTDRLEQRLEGCAVTNPPWAEPAAAMPG